MQKFILDLLLENLRRKSIRNKLQIKFAIKMLHTQKITSAMATFSKIDEQDYIRFKQEKYQYEVLTDNKENIIKKYDITTIDKPSIEDIMLLYVKGEK